MDMPSVYGALGLSDEERSDGRAKESKIMADPAFEAAKLDLQNHVTLYQFYVGAYIKGIAFFLAINAVLFKFALDDKPDRLLFSLVALGAGLAILMPLFFGRSHALGLADLFQKLSRRTETEVIDVSPLKMLVRTTAIFWSLIFVLWLYMLKSSLS